MPVNGFDCYIRKVIEDGKPIFPEAFCLTEQERVETLAKDPNSKLESIERLKHTNKAKFYGQYLNDPLDDALLEFKREWFQPFNIIPGTKIAEELVNVPVLISVDPAFRLKQTNDNTGIVVTKTLSDNNVYIMEARGIKVNPKMLVDEIMAVANRYINVHKILIETVTSQLMLMDLLHARMRETNKFFVIEEVKPDTNEVKAARIRNLIPHYSNRRIYHAPGLTMLEDELLEFPKGMHDDVIDALSYQVKYWRPFNQTDVPQNVPHGSYEWWRRKTGHRPTVIGKLFGDLKHRR